MHLPQNSILSSSKQSIDKGVINVTDAEPSQITTTDANI